MGYFLDTQETIPAGAGFELFHTEHWLCLGIIAIVMVLGCRLYLRLDRHGRESWRKTVAILILADELFKHVCLLIGGTFLAKYLPLHLCSINIFLVAIHAWKPNRLLDQFLYLVCLPGAVLPLFFCTWAMLPPVNFMYLHSYSIHMLLVLYPLAMTLAGDIRPQPRMFYQCILLLAGMALPLYFLNQLWDTNFMFLSYPEAGTPLVWFEEHWGNHLLGFPVLIPAVLAVMSVPAWILNRRKT